MSQIAVNNVWSDRISHDVTSHFAPLMARVVPIINLADSASAEQSVNHNKEDGPFHSCPWIGVIDPFPLYFSIQAMDIGRLFYRH